MSESEFDIIKNYFHLDGETSQQPDWLDTGIGDDAAILNTAPFNSSQTEQQLIAVDTLNAGVHFLEDTAPADIGYKALAVNVSDIAAMGGQPLWFTLAISLPKIDHDWLKDFCTGLSEMANQHAIKLIGGDTTSGPLSITIQIAGKVPAQQALKRSGARPGDDIYVTGSLGDGAAGLSLLQQGEKKINAYQQTLIDRLHRPIPRVNVGIAIRKHASACIDISDGLAGDLGHILERSSSEANKLGAELHLDRIPLSESLQQSGLAVEKQQALALHGGDDYELCFTAPQSERLAIEMISQQSECPISNIGSIIEEQGLYIIEKEQRIAITETGFDHFAKS